MLTELVNRGAGAALHRLFLRRWLSTRHGNHSDFIDRPATDES
ncbi:hypothetical protein SS05631_c01810 [Sinorhizobium sp. CCBAU 05631]|nr:hypothetical protein SS05631_c01810 [Sinorhizobium sp. CCBAU 05631]